MTTKSRTSNPVPKKDEYFMRAALRLARKGRMNTSPNPLVGSVVVKNGTILAGGYHRKLGFPHAEIEALKKAGGAAKDATLYVNLEPCCHFGRTPPCVDNIISSGIRRVVIGMRDPNPVNNGKGIKKLRQNGIDVTCGVLKKEAGILNRAFSTYITKKRPYVTIKTAQSLDGKIATFTGHSKWITNEFSRKFVQKLRSNADAVVVGINTVLMDDPMLNARTKNAKRQPLKIILDSRIRTPMHSKVIKDRSAGVIIAAARDIPVKKTAEFKNLGIDVVAFRGADGKVDIRSLLRYLAQRGISHILVEGGGTVTAGFLNSGLADEMFIFISPIIIGGKDAVTSVEGDGAVSVDRAIKLKDVELKRFGEDILIRGYVHGNN